jgi:hypothetical protein
VLQSFFISMFELLHGGQSNPAFRDSVYSGVGSWLLGITLLTVVFYYYVLNGIWARYARLKYWIVTMLASVFLNVVAVLVVERNVQDLPIFGPASTSLMVIDALYAAIAFLVASLLLKWFSPNARRTPF